MGRCIACLRLVLRLKVLDSRYWKENVVKQSRGNFLQFYINALQSLPRYSQTQNSMVLLNNLKPSGYYMYNHTKTPHFAHRVYLCVPYDSHNKQRLFP
jgi:hypothetical protein